MATFDARLLGALRYLLQASHTTGPDDLPGGVSEAGRLLGADRAELLLADYDQVELVPLVTSVDRRNRTGAVAIDGTLPGRAFSEVAQQVSSAGPGPVLWTPVLDGTDRLGVLMLAFADGVELDAELCSGCLDLASLLAELVLSRSAYGDAVEFTRRRTEMTVPAELQWEVLPPLTFVGPRVAVAGVLAPTAEVAGDSFDYAVNGDTVHLVVLDAMGHGMEATLLSAVAVATLRAARRSGRGLAEAVLAVDAALVEQFGGDRFVTGVVGELDLATGWWRWVNCGHPPALVVRGGKVVRVLDEVGGPPMGLELFDGEPVVGQERLQPGDRVLLYTDGVIEARDADGEFFGIERLVALATREAVAGRPVPETLRRLNLAILAHQEGVLQDDATTVLLEWLVVDEPAASTSTT